jgi:hypothetical protein
MESLQQQPGAVLAEGSGQKAARPTQTPQLLQGSRPLTSLQLVFTGALERVHAEFGAMLHAAAASNDADK